MYNNIGDEMPATPESTYQSLFVTSLQVASLLVLGWVGARVNARALLSLEV